MRKLLLILTLLILTPSCNPVTGVAQPTSNPSAKVEALFDVDGYRVYRFNDGHSVYFVLPARGERGRVASTSQEVDCSTDDKNPCTFPMNVPTALGEVAEVAWSEVCGKNCTRPALTLTHGVGK